MNENIKADLLLFTNAVLGRCPQECVVLCLIDVAILECGTMLANIGSLGKRADCGGGKQREIEGVLLDFCTFGVGTEAGEVRGGECCDAIADDDVRAALRRHTVSNDGCVRSQCEFIQVVTAGVIVMAASTEGLNLRPKEVRRGDSFELEGAGQFDGHSGVKRVGLPAAGQSKDRRVERHHVQH
jgi:hypothetical protein